MEQPRAGAILIIQNGAWEYLLQFRDGTPGISHPLTWGTVGGWVEAGEDPLAGAVRELEEELGIEARPEELEQIDLQAIAGVQEYVFRLTRPVEWGSSSWRKERAAGSSLKRKP